MKLTTKIFAGAAALAFLTLTAGSLQAQGTLTNVVTISFTATLQNPKTNDNGTVTTTSAPITHSASMSTILGWMATDSSTTFPAGAKLVAISNPTNNSPDFQVLDKHNNFLADVSGLLTITNSGVFGSDVTSGKSNDTNNLAAPTTTDEVIYTVTYDDSSILGGADVQFSFSGVFKNVTTDSKPSNTGVYKETQSHILSSGTGDGAYLGDPAIVTGGSFKASGSGTLSLP